MIPFLFLALFAYACGGGGSGTEENADEVRYSECLEKMEATHGDGYSVAAREEYCKCAVATFNETFSANDRALMSYGMSNEQAVQYEEALAPCREQLEGTATSEEDTAGE